MKDDVMKVMCSGARRLNAVGVNLRRPLMDVEKWEKFSRVMKDHTGPSASFILLAWDVYLGTTFGSNSTLVCH